MDGNGDGTLDMDLTFIPWDQAPGRVLWLRNRYLAGPREGDVRPGASGMAPTAPHGEAPRPPTRTGPLRR